MQERTATSGCAVRSLRATPGRPPAVVPPDVAELKWTEAEFAEAKEGRLPMGKATDEWTVGDVEAGFKDAALVLDETFVTPNTSHQCLETRTAMAYWQNGKVYVHTGAQSTAQTVPAIARWLGIEPEKVVFISEYTGGGFGSKITGAITLIIPALLSKKTNAPVMMRISREEEHFIGRGRPSFHGRMKVGFSKEGRITAIDMFVVCDNGPYDQVGDAISSSRIVSLLYQPQAMRWRGVTVLTNTPPRSAQSSPGGMQGITLMEPLLAKAARKLGVDQVAIRRINAPEGKAKFGPPAGGKQAYITSAFIKEALDRGAAQFKWDERKAQPKRSGTKARGVGVSSSCYVGGSIGFDGLFIIKPDGRLYIQSGIGNLGTESVSDVHRVVAELIGVPWDKCEIAWGNSAKNLPWACPSGGSQTTHAMTRAAHAVAMDATKKLQEIAAKDLGGKPEDYEVANERVFRKGGGAGMSLAQAAKRAIELGGIYDGHELPKDINKFTVASATALAGQGLLAVAKDNYPRDGVTHSFVATFAEVEVDLETGQYHIVDFLAYADVGTVLHPQRPGRPGSRPIDAGHRPRHRPEVGLRPALRASRRQAVPPHQAADDSGHPSEHAVGGGRHTRSGNAGRSARHWRATGRRRVLCNFECPVGRAGRRNIPARARDRRRYFGVARSGQADARASDRAHLRAAKSRDEIEATTGKGQEEDGLWQ